MPIKILLADDHKIVRDGLRSLLERQPDMEVIADAADGRDALRIAQKLSPDVVVIDIGMPGLNGIDATRQIVTSLPDTRVIGLSMHADRRYVMGMLKAGAAGYLVKDSAFEELIQAIHVVMGGRTFIGSGLADGILQDFIRLMPEKAFSAAALLSMREREVLQLLAEGRAMKHIAETLNLSVKTVETHRKQIMDKVGVHSVAELTKYAIREGLTSL